MREAINETSRYALTAENLLTPDNQNKIVEIATEKIKEIRLENSELSLEPLVDIKETAKRYTESFIKLNISVPRIKILYEQEGDFTLTILILIPRILPVINLCDRQLSSVN